MMRKAWVTGLVLAAALAGCGRPALTGAVEAAGAEAKALAAQAAANGIPEAEQPALAAALDEISSEFMEDGEARMMAPPVVPAEATVKGGFWYQSFVKSSILRGIGYGLAKWPVKRHFSKPSKSKDTIAPVRGAELEALKASLKAGDVVQCGNDGSFVHALLYLGDDRIVHALAQPGFGKSMIGVRAETLTEYFNRVERDKFVVLRPTWTPEQLGIAHDYAMAQVGKKYDTMFLTDSDDRHYCTELVYQALTRAGVARIQPKLAKFKWRLVTNEEIRKSVDLVVVSRRNAD